MASPQRITPPRSDLRSSVCGSTEGCHDLGVPHRPQPVSDSLGILIQT